MIALPYIRRPSLRTEYLLSALFIGLSVQLLSLQASAVRSMRDIGLPAALTLPSIEHRMGILKEQSEVAAMQASLTGDSSEEMLHMYVLPDGNALDRLLGSLDTLTSELRRQGALTALSPIHTGDSVEVPITDADGKTSTFSKVPVSFEADVTEEGLQTLFLFQELSGFLTVGDLFPAEAQSELLHLTEQENPAAVTALETFLSTDLLTYAQAPDAVDNQLFKSFSSAGFAQTFHMITAQSSLSRVTALLSGPVGRALQKDKLWPLRFLLPVKSAIRQTGEGTYHVAVEWGAYGRMK